MARRGYSQKDQDALKAYHKTAAKKQQEKKRQQERAEQARKSAQRVQTANANKNRRSTDTNKNAGKRTVYYRSKDDPSKTVTRPVKPQTAKQQKSLAYRSKDDAKPVTGKQWNTLKNAKPKTGLQVKQEAARKYERQTGQPYKPRTMQELVTGERIWKPDKRAENRARAEGDAARRLGGDFPLPTARKKQQGPSTWDMVNRLYDEDEKKRADSAVQEWNDPESEIGHRYNAVASTFGSWKVGRDGKLYHHGDQPVTQEMINDLFPYGADEDTQKMFESFGFTVKPYDLTKSEAENNIEKAWMRANWSTYDDHGRADDGADQMRMMRNSYAWQKAKERGDTDEMERLHQENERIRAKYGYSGGEDGSEYLRGKTTLAETFDRSSVADAALSNARRRLENATTEEEKKAAQQEIDYILSNPNYRGDAGRRFDLLNESAYHQAVGGTMQYIQAQRQQANYAASENAWKYWEQEANKVQGLREQLKTLTPNTAEYNKVEQEIRRGEAAAEEMRKLKADPNSPFFDYRTAMDHPEIIQPIYDPKWGNMVRQGQREMEEATEGMGEFGKGAAELYVNALEMAPTFAASLIPGVGPVSMAIRAAAGTAALGQMTFAAGGQRYVDLVDQGVPLRQAAADAVIAQNIELLTESVPFHMMGKIVTGASPLASSALKAVAGSSAIEGAEEIVAGGLNYAWGHGARGYQFDTWSPQDAAKEFLFGAIMGGVHSGAAVAINRGIRYLATRGDREGIDYMNARMGDMDQLTERYKNLYDQFQAGEVSQEEYERQTLKIQEDTTSALRQMRDYLKEHGEGAEISDRVRGLAENVTNRAGIFNAMMNATQQQRPQKAAPSNQSTVPPIVQTADQVKEQEQKASPAERIQSEAEEAIKAGAQAIQQQQAQEEEAALMDDAGTPADSTASRYQKAAEAARGEQETAPKGQAEQISQPTQNTKAAPSNDLVERYANTMGESGKAAIRTATEGLEGQARSQLAYNFADTYLKALTGNRTVKPESMTQAQYDAAVQAGVRDKAVRDQRFRDFDATVRKGKVAHSAADVKMIGADSLKVMRAAADAFGVPVVVVNQSRIAGGENVPEGLTLNGEYRNGVIYLNRDALKKNAKPEDLARFVLGHELTHRLQEVATDEYNKLYEYVMQMPEYRDRVMRVARIRGATSNAVDMAGAADEVVADYVGQLVADSAELQRFITEFREEKGLLQKILDFLRELASRLVGKHDANLDRSIRLLEDALKAGSEYVQSVQNGETGTKSAQNARRSGTVVQNQDLAEQAKRLRDARRELAEQERRTTEMRREIERGEGRHSITTTGEGAGFDVIENHETHMVEFWSDGVKVDYVTPDMLDERGMIGALIKLARDEAGTITPSQARGQMQGFADLLNLILSSQDSEMVWAMAGSALFSAVKANSDKQYKTTIDFGTICVKTQNMIDAMTNTMAETGRGLTKDEIMEIQHDIITEHGTVPCPVCYVFSRWAGVGGLLDNMKRYHYKYLDMTHEQVEQEIKKLSAAQTTEVKEAARNDPDFGPRYRELEDMVKTSEDPDVIKQAKKELKEYEKAVKRRAMIAADEVYANLASEEETTVAKLERVRKELTELNRTAKSRRENAMAIELRRKSRDKLNERIKDLRKAMEEIENAGGPELSWLKRVRVKPNYFEKGVFTDADGNILEGKDLDAILFNLNAADEWASNAPLLWEFRKSRGAGLGKAILPYSDYRFGDLILGDKKNSATGEKTFTKVGKTLTKLQMNKYHEAVKRTLAQNWMGGQRFQSTSDFRYDYALDYMQAFLELQALGGSMQTYTKVIEFADMVARIGGDVNMSVMPFERGYDANGRLIYSDVTGMNADEAIRMRNRTNSAQLILVGINDEHIRLAMEDSEASGGIFVDFIIPYHPSGAKVDTFIKQLIENLGETYNPGYYMNYEPVQNDVERDDATTEQLRRAALRQQLLTGTQKVGKKSVPWTPSEADMKLINRRSKNIRDRSFEELRDIEKRALKGDKAAIKEYVSWSAGVLGNIYKAFWSEKSIYAQHGVHLTNEQAGQIMPNEYWDQKTTRDNAYINGFIFRSWCYSLGLHPRFTGWSSKGKIDHGDFTGQKGYWKVLIDRRMYDMNGKFRPQRPINITAMTTKEGLADLTPPAEDDPRYQVQTNRGEEGAGERAAKRFVERVRSEGRQSYTADSDEEYMDDFVGGRRFSLGRTNKVEAVETKRQQEDDYEAVTYEVRENGKTVGSAMAVVSEEEGAYIERIDIDDSERGKGIGTKALNQLAKEYGFVYLAPDNERAKELYERIGDEYTGDDAEYIDQGFGVYEIYPQEERRFSLGRRTDAEYMDAVKRSVTEDDRNPLTEAEIEELADLTEEINPTEIVPWNEVQDPEKYRNLVDEFSENGWSGRPIVAIQYGQEYRALTGSHRIAAARAAGIDVPTIVLDYDDDTREFIDPIDADEYVTDEMQGELAFAMAERGAIPLSVAKLINREWELNYDNWGVPTLEQERWSISESDTDALEQARLLRENQNLRDRLEFWQGQVKQTDRTRVEPAEVRKYARRLMRENEISPADLDLDDLAADLQELYDGVGKDWTYEQARQAARSIAENVVYSMDWTEDLEDTEATILGLFHGMPIYLNESVRSNIPDYEIWRRRNLGRLRIVHSAKKGIPVDVFYEEVLRAEMPWIFPEVQGDGQALEQIYEALRGVDDGKWRTDLSKDRAYMESAINDFTKKIMLQHYEFPAIKKTFADRMNDRLEKQKARTGKANELAAARQEEIRDLRKQLKQAEKDLRKAETAAERGEKKVAAGEEKAAKQRQAAEKKVQRLEEKLREAEQQARWDMAAERLASDMAHGRELQRIKNLAERNLAKAKERHEAKEARIREQARQREKRGALKREERKVRDKILRHVRKLSVKLTNPTDTQHVPEQLRGPVAMALASIDTGSKYEIVFGKDGEYHRVKRGSELGAEQTKRTEAFAKLQAVYLQIVKEAEPVVVDPDLVENIGDIIGFADTPIENLGLDQLQTIWDTVRAIEASISTYNKALGQARFANIMEPSLAIRDYLSGRKDRGNFRGPLRPADRLMTANLRPYEFLRRLGRGGKDIWRMLRDAQDRKIVILRDAKRDLREILSGTNWKRLEKQKETFQFEDATVTLTKAQIMGLYELLKRPQAVEHIMVGGIRPDVVKKGIKERTPSEPWTLTQDQISEVVSVLSDEETALADRLQKFLEGLSDLGNEASMEVYGYKKFREKNYFPIKVDRNEVVSDIKNEAVSGSIAGWGSSRPTTPHAKNAVILSSIFDVVAEHTSEMATYTAWLGPMENFNRIFNFRYKQEDGTLRGGVKADLERAFGKNGPAYWRRLRDDLNNGIRGETDNPFQAFVGAYKGSAVGANLRVIAQQPTAIFRALYVMNPVDLVAGIALTHPTKYNRIVKEYAPIAVWKSWGYFEADVGKQIRSILLSDDTPLERVKGILMAGAGIMDSIAWSHIWNSLEVETRRKRKDLTPGSDEFYQAVAERFNEVIDSSQVVDGTLQRSQVMRAADGVTKMATSFMSEPTMVFNMFTGAIYDVQHSTGRERGAAMARAARTCFALGLSIVVNAAVQSLIDGLRDDDKDEKYWEKFFQAYLGEGETKGERIRNGLLNSNLGQAVNPATYIPWAKDIISLAQGYKVSRMDMDSITKVMQEFGNTIKSMNGEGKLTPQNAWLRLSVEMARLLGIPAANLKRDIMSVMWTYANQTGNWRLLYAIEKFQFDPTASGNLGEFAKIAFAAREAGDDEAADYIEQDMLAAGVEQKKLDNKLETLAKNKMGENEEYQAAYEQYLDTYTTQLNAYPATANLDDDTREKMEKAVDDYAKYKAALEYDESLAGDSSTMQAMQALESEGIDPVKYKLAQAVTSGIGAETDADGNEIKTSASIRKMQALKEAGVEFEEPEWDAYKKMRIAESVYTMTPEEFDEAVADLEEKINAPSPFDVYGTEKRETLKALDEFQKNNHSEHDPATGKEIKGQTKKDKFVAYLSDLDDLSQVEKAEMFAKYYPKSPKNPFA